MAYEKFIRGNLGPRTDTEWLSIQGNGNISVSIRALEALGKPDRVTLHHDPVTHSIALKAATSDDGNSYRVQRQGGRDHRSDHGAHAVSATAFCHHIGLHYALASGRYDVTVSDGMVIAQLPASAFGDGSES